MRPTNLGNLGKRSASPDTIPENKTKGDFLLTAFPVYRPSRHQGARKECPRARRHARPVTARGPGRSARRHGEQEAARRTQLIRFGKGHPYVRVINRVISGDCIEVLKQLPDRSIDFVLTDPPYLVRYRDRSSRTGANATGRLAEARLRADLPRVSNRTASASAFTAGTRSTNSSPPGKQPAFGPLATWCG